MDSVLHLIFLRKVNILQVYNKLEVSITFKVFQELLLFYVTAGPLLRSSQSTQ